MLGNILFKLFSVYIMVKINYLQKKLNNLILKKCS